MAVTEEVKVRKHNLRVYPKYLMLGYDLLFFYGIRVMFLLDVKGITESQILLAATVYALSMIVMQVPATLLVSKIGYKNTAIAGNIFNIIWIPKFISNINKKEDRTIILFILIICLFMYWFIISMYRPEWYGVIPYKTFFTEI